MTEQTHKTHFLHSLRTQLCIGAIVLLGLTVSAISYSLIIHERNMLTAEIQKTIVLQGRNIALSSEKSLLRSDPEFELYPLVTRLLENTSSIVDIKIVDADNTVQGDKELVNVSKPLPALSTAYEVVQNPLVQDTEILSEDDEVYVFQTPVLSGGQRVGSVVMSYSKAELHEGIQHSIRLTITFSLVALVIGIIASLLVFQRISAPMQVMINGVRSLGQGDLNTKILMPSKNEFRILAQSFNDMATRISSNQRDLLAKERMDRELEIAREIQRSLIPSDVVAPTGYDIGHYYKSALEVGGDYMDVMPAGDGRIALVIADVSGKGVPGLVVMAMVKILVQRLVLAKDSPKEIVTKLNQSMFANTGRNMFVTFFVGILDTSTGVIVFSNGGHNPTILFNEQTQSARLFKMDGPPVGAFPSNMFDPLVKEYRVELQPGDLLLQYTDGLNESNNVDGEQFNFDRIVDICKRFGSAGAPSVVRELVDAENRFRGAHDQFDDITLLAVSRQPLESGVVRS